MPTRNTPEKFWRRVLKTDCCWLWQGACLPGKSSYGRLRYHMHDTYAHRVAWILTHGPVPHGLHVLHHCDNPPCCNPTHLFLGTALDNKRDAIAKGRAVDNSRFWIRYGEDSHLSKLTWQEVQEIRAYPRYRGAFTDLGRRYGVAASTIAAIVHGKTWKHQP